MNEGKQKVMLQLQFNLKQLQLLQYKLKKRIE